MVQSKFRRTVDFRWKTRHELYTYFYEHYGVDKKQVDLEIQRVMAMFKPRKGEAIKTEELWQKVGIDLESEITGYTKTDAMTNEQNFEVSPEQLDSVDQQSITDYNVPKTESGKAVSQSEGEIFYLEDI